MAANSSAHPVHPGFNQSGGAHFMVLSALEATPGTAAYVNTLTAGGSNSGGAYVAPVLALTSMSNVYGTGAAVSDAHASAVVGANKLLKDMGRSVVSAGRVFRKFAPVVANSGLANNASTFGVVGGAASGANAGYCTFYLEVGREGEGAAPAPIARYF